MIKKNKMLFFVVFGLFLLLSTTNYVLGDGVEDPTDLPETDGDEDDDEIDDELEEKSARNIQVNVESDHIEIESDLKNGNQKDEMDISVEWDDSGLGIKLKYSTEYDEADVETEYELQFKVQFTKIIEFVDIGGSNADGIYNAAEDEMKSEYLLDSWGTPIYDPQTDASGKTLHKISIETDDGIFKVIIYAVEEFEVVNSSLINPGEIKFDIEIHNFAFVDSSSKLALHTKLESESEYELEEESEDESKDIASEDEKQVKIESQGETGFFAWAETALVDGVNKTVLSSPVQTDDEESSKEKIYLNYEHGTDIIHDPKMGVSGIITMPGTLAIPSYSIIGIGAFLLIGVAAVLFKMMKKDR